MGKQKIKKTIFSKISYDGPIKAKEYMHLLEEDDIVYADYQEAEYHSDSGMEAHYYLAVERMVMETDEEYEKRKADIEKMKEDSRKREYATYLRLKEKFENDSEKS